MRLAHRLRVLVLFAASPAFWTLPAHAFEIAAGFAAVEEGDDRLRPAAAVHVGFPRDFEGNLYYYGREFGPVKEQTVIVNFVKSWDVFNSKFLEAHFGPCLMDEKTDVSFDGEDSEESQSEDNLNAGAVYGINFALPKAGPLYLAASWDSHIFAAGINGGLLLSSGRKQTISLVGGVAFK